jgi:hypothetical protein
VRTFLAVHAGDDQRIRYGHDQFVECFTIRNSANPRGSSRTIFGDCQMGCQHRFELVLCSHPANDCKAAFIAI